MSKKLHLAWLSVGVAASALFFGGCVVSDGEKDGPAQDVAGADDDADEAAAGGLEVKLSSGKTAFGMDDAVRVTLTLTNNTERAVRLLSWVAPDGELEEDLFVVALAGKTIDYIGPHYKRPAPEEADYITLAAGQSLSRSVDLTSFYDFSETGDYSVRYTGHYLPEGSKEAVPAESREAGLWIEGHPIVQAPEIKSIGGQAGIAFSKCTTTQADTVTQALAAAQAMATGAKSYLSSAAPSGTPRYTTWFGSFTSARWSTASSHYVAIEDALYNKPMSFDCGCKKKYYAYVYPNQPYNVYLCSVFWDAPMTGTDSKGGTIIHETSHFTAVVGTDDWVYGQSGAKSLASSDPTKALDNADNHEYFAENTPSLN